MTKRYFLGYTTIFKPTLSRNVEVWKLFDRRSAESNLKKPRHTFEIECSTELDKVNPYHVRKYNPELKDYEPFVKTSTLEMSVISCLNSREKYDLLDDVVEVGLRSSL